jgi:hypothetical protein
MTLGACVQHRSKAFVRPAAIPISNEIQNSFGAVYFTLFTAACHYSMSTTNTERTLKCCSIIFTLRRCQAQPLLLIMKSPSFIKGIVSRDFGTLFLISLDRFEGHYRAGSGLFFILMMFSCLNFKKLCLGG